MSSPPGDVIPITTKAAYMFTRSTLRDAELMSAVCIICKYPVSDLCVQCKQNPSADRADCQLVRGECGHINHSHCSSEWVRSNNTCPTCSKPWRQQGPDFQL